LLSQFEALYTSSPTAQQTTDLTAAYNALAAAVSSSNITSANITTINNDWSAVLAAEGSTSTATYPYFNLVTGHGAGSHGFGGGCG
jgi:NADH dehydrogenase FAD-containing subunit